MRFNFCPDFTLPTEEEKKILIQFKNSLIEACKTNPDACCNCLFTEFCDTNGNNPGFLVEEILKKLDIEVH